MIVVRFIVVAFLMVLGFACLLTSASCRSLSRSISHRFGPVQAFRCWKREIRAELYAFSAGT